MDTRKKVPERHSMRVNPGREALYFRLLLRCGECRKVGMRTRMRAYLFAEGKYLLHLGFAHVSREAIIGELLRHDIERTLNPEALHFRYCVIVLRLPAVVEAQSTAPA